MSSNIIATSVPFVRGSSKVIGVFGHPVEHSLSPAMHNAALATLNLPFIYVPFAVRPDALATAIRSLPALGIVGVNLTIPHKEAVLSYLDETTSLAQQIGAVNTVHCVEGKLIGDNTDGFGFYEPLRERGVAVAGKSVVVLGAGGAARAVAFQLAQEGAKIILTNRTSERAERLAEAVHAYYPGAVQTLLLDDEDALGTAISCAELLVQTTRIGMYPYGDALPPVPLNALHPNLLVYDLVYNPVETMLLREARQRRCRVLAGVKMLVYQGAAAFRLWTGVWPPTEIMERAVLQGLQKNS